MSWNLVSPVDGLETMVLGAVQRTTRAVVVGWRRSRLGDVVEQLLDGPIGVPRVHIVEAWSVNADLANTRYRNEPRVVVECAQVEEFMACGRLRPTDMLVWLHGPEHVEVTAGVHLITEMQNAGPAAIVLEAPEGTYEQGAIDGNPFEVHRSVWRVSLFEQLGFATARSREGDFTIAVWRPE